MDLSNHKSLGPNGFNGEFLKKYWPSITQDFYDLCDAFYEGTICLKSINASYTWYLKRTAPCWRLQTYFPP